MSAIALDLLRSVTPEQVRRRHLVHVSRFTDSDIQPGDFDTWAEAEMRFHFYQVDRDKVERLKEDIEVNGLRRKIEIVVHTCGSTTVIDGHHRVIALKQLGMKYFPYRWFVASVGRNRYLHKQLPEHQVDENPRLED